MTGILHVWPPPIIDFVSAYLNSIIDINNFMKLIELRGFKIDDIKKTYLIILKLWQSWAVKSNNKNNINLKEYMDNMEYSYQSKIEALL